MQYQYWLTDQTPGKAFSEEGLYVEHDEISVSSRILVVTLVAPYGEIKRNMLETIMSMEFVNCNGEILSFQCLQIQQDNQALLFYAAQNDSMATPAACVIAELRANTETINRLAA